MQMNGSFSHMEGKTTGTVGVIKMLHVYDELQCSLHLRRMTMLGAPIETVQT